MKQKVEKEIQKPIEIKPKEIKQKVEKEIQKPKEIKPADLEEKIWIEGYKIVRPNRTGYNDFKFELNTVYTVERPEEIKPGQWGFHFWKNIHPKE